MGKKILIIDDDVTTSKMLGVKLKKAGFDVVIAMDPLYGLRAAHSGMPDIIVLDLLMPAGGGLFFLDKITRSPTTTMIPVIVTSATEDKKMIQDVLERGIIFVQKPYDLEALIEKIKLILEGSIDSIPGNTPD